VTAPNGQPQTDIRATSGSWQTLKIVLYTGRILERRAPPGRLKNQVFTAGQNRPPISGSIRGRPSRSNSMAFAGHSLARSPSTNRATTASLGYRISSARLSANGASALPPTPSSIESVHTRGKRKINPCASRRAKARNWDNSIYLLVSLGFATQEKPLRRTTSCRAAGYGSG